MNISYKFKKLYIIKNLKHKKIIEQLSIIICIVLVMQLFVLIPSYAAAKDHVIYEVDWKSDHEAVVTLKWSDKNNKTPIMITSWIVNEDKTVTIRYNQGNSIQEGFNKRIISDNNMNCPCIFLLSENIIGNSEIIFPDLPKAKESITAISHLYNLGIINGYPNGSFNPSGNVSRAEFSKMLYLSGKMLDELDSPIVFSDVNNVHWAKRYIYTLASKKIVNGKGNNIFDPEGTITIGEVLTIINRSFELYGDTSSYPYGLIDRSIYRYLEVNTKNLIKEPMV